MKNAVKKVFFVSLIVSVLVALVLLFVTISRHSPNAVSETVSTHLWGIPFFDSSRIVIDSGSQSSLEFRWGIYVVLIGIPLLLTFVTWTLYYFKKSD
ncbi:MAG: hypothetical protein J6M18_02630 [Actinomycetaceae bacterium]|nr:hypothetical protein [Actinomycetaceae bacterium]